MEYFPLLIPSCPAILLGVGLEGKVGWMFLLSCRYVLARILQLLLSPAFLCFENNETGVQPFLFSLSV